MSTVLERMRERIKTEEEPVISQVFKYEGEKKEDDTVEAVPTPVQTLTQPKVIKQNNPGVPTMGFTMGILTDELGTVLQKAMHKAGVSSVGVDVFGIFDQLDLVPKGFDKVTDEFTGKKFFVLQNANRMTEIFKSLVKALNTSSLDVISFPYLIETELDLPIKYISEDGDFEYSSVKTQGLYLTTRELDALNYKFITEIQFCEKNEEDPESVDLLVMKVDREEWKAAPFRI